MPTDKLNPTARIAAFLVVGLFVFVARSAGEKPASADGFVDYTAISEGVTSFGAAIVDDTLYIYGGHRGGEHDYSADEQSNQFRRLRLAKDATWEDLSAGPKLQGLALVAHGGKLYRVGGFTAHNAVGEEHDLRSVADVAVFDPKAKVWKAAPFLPQPRSSHDAVVHGDLLFVAGGWQLRGKGQEPVWQDAAFVMDLSAAEPKWEALPKPPFRRRALSLAAVDGKVYAIGGMQPDRTVSCSVDVYDIESKKWSKAPNLPGEGMDGFGTSAYGAAGRLYVSNVAGNVFCLGPKDKKWGVSGKLREKRLFHRMLATADDKLLIVGGAEWQSGKAKTIYAVPISTNATAQISP